MAESTPDATLQSYFNLMESQGVSIVSEQPKLDLDLYIQNYLGRTQFDRLLHIGKTCKPLCVDALKAAVADAKKGNDVSRYQEAWDCIRLAAPHEPEAVKDEKWIETVSSANQATTKSLEDALKMSRNNLIKESIRMGNEELGKHFESIGNLDAAAETYGRMRQDVSSTKHIIDCGFLLANVCLQRRDWTMTLNNVGKVSGVISDIESHLMAKSKVRIISGIAHLGAGRFAEAAKNFILIGHVIAAKEYKNVGSPNDVATYGGLLALATMDRRELQTRVIDNQLFRGFLEHEPHIRKAVSHFIYGRYSNCLSILEAYRNDYKLDIYLSKHVTAIYDIIRSKCIVQYLISFSRVSIQSLEEAFSQPGRPIEPELIEMILNGRLNAKIDAKNKLLTMVRPDARLEMQKNALEAARKYEDEATERLRRISIIAAGLESTQDKKSGAGGHSMYDSNVAEPRVPVEIES